MNGIMRVVDGRKEYMVPVDYPSNSRRSREQAGHPEEKKKVEQVVTGEVVTRRKGFGRRFIEDLIGDEGLEGAVSNYITDILARAFKGLVWDTFENFTGAFRDGMHRALYGTARRPGPYKPGTTYFNYSKVSTPVQRPEYETISQKARARHDFEELLYRNRGDAEELLDGLRELVDVYGVASVADFYAMAGVTMDFPDEGWGWYDVRSAKVRPVRGGYIISLPRPQPLTE